MAYGYRGRMRRGLNGCMLWVLAIVVLLALILGYGLRNSGTRVPADKYPGGSHGPRASSTAPVQRRR